MSKKQRKEQIQKEWGLAVDGKIPMVLVSAADVHIQKILEDIVDGIAAIGIQLILVDDSPDGQCSKWHVKHPDSVKCISPDEIANDVFDIELVENLTDERMKFLKENRVVPIAEKGKIEPFDPVEEKGNGFLFESNSPWSLFAALVRAAETYRFPYDWQNIVKAVEKTA